jgi:hypothetical protein
MKGTKYMIVDDTAEKAALYNRVVNVYVETEQTKRAIEAIEFCRSHHENAKEDVPQDHLFILGNSRAGKTRMVKRYSMRPENKPYIQIDEMGNETLMMPVVYISLYRPFTIIGFFQQILEALGRPVFPTKPSIDSVRRAAMNLLKDQGVKVIIVDEIQSVINTPFVKPADALQPIKDVSDNGKVSIIGCGLPEAKGLSSMDDQYAFRFRTFHMHPFEACNEEFLSFIKGFEEQINAPFPLGISDNPARCETLFKATEGLPGKVYDFFEELFFQLGINNPDVRLSQMKVTNNIIIDTAKVVRSRRKP